MVVDFCTQMNEFHFHRALQAVWEVVGLANRYIVTNAPWELAKDLSLRQRLDTVLYNLLETLRQVALLLNAVMPETAAKMQAALGIDGPVTLDGQAAWGGVLQPGRAIQLEASLFPRLDKAVEPQVAREAAHAAPAKPKKAEVKRSEELVPAPAAPAEGLITFDEFKRLDLRVATVLAAEKVAKSDRLLKLTLAAPETRTVVAGIAEHYAPEEMVGRQVIICANLKPTKLMGIESQGMVLAAKSGGALFLSTVAGAVDAGSRVS
jgi:methionyl-tRNA synthetase